jgi:hypothetical protein
MKTFQQLFDEHNGNGILKWSHYPEIYDKHFTKYRELPINILEIGILNGGSLQIWEKYFPRAKIFAIDIDEKCKQYESDRTKIFIGDQADKFFLRNVKAQLPQIDIIIDDGGHRAEQQINTFEEMYYHLKTTGVYLIEDIELNYRQDKKPGNFMDLMKSKIDELNIRRTLPLRTSLSNNWKDLEVRFTNTTNSITFYDNVVVIEKDNIKTPREIRK